MLRSLALITLSLSSVVWFGCSNNDSPTPPKPPVVVGDDMATDGTGGNGGTGGTGGGGGGGSGGQADMAMSSSGGDMSPGLPDLAGLPAPDHDPTQHPTPIRLIQPVGTNSTIKNPEIWTVVWKGDKDTIGAQVNKFTQWMLTSDYWKNTAEYGVGMGVAKGVIELDDAPPAQIDMSTINSLVDQNPGGKFPTANANTIFSFVTNPNTKVMQGAQQAGCVAFDGYHQLALNGAPFLVNVYCPDAMGNPDWNNLTVTVSHEAVEAATDWDLNHNRAYYPGTTTVATGGGETGDLCIAQNEMIPSGTGDTYNVQRVFSDAAAAKGNVWYCPWTVNPTRPWFGAGLYSGGTNDAVIKITRTAGKGTANIKIEPFAYGDVGPIGFYVVGSWLPTKGVTLVPDIARRSDGNGGVLGTRIWGNAGSTTMVQVNVDSTLAATDVGKVWPFLVIAHNQDKSQISAWWASLQIK
jgi:hypothetical protein